MGMWVIRPSRSYGIGDLLPDTYTGDLLEVVAARSSDKGPN